MIWKDMYAKLKSTFESAFDNTDETISSILVGADHILLALSILTVLVLFYAVVFETRRYRKKI